jgi:SAM-dependent methyltransferase
MMLKRLKRFLVNLARFLSRPFERWIVQRHEQKMEAIVKPDSDEYSQYLRLQLRRSLSKRKSPLQTRTRDLIDHISENLNLSQKVILCIGCRNKAELDYFQAKGAQHVVGIDLFSQSQDILIMDMHHMTFPDNAFDIIYASHSLEHAHTPSQVVTEIVRVARPGAIIAIEVPVDFEPRGSDMVDFIDLETLHRAFQAHLADVLWSERYHSMEACEKIRSTCIRTIFRINK